MTSEYAVVPPLAELPYWTIFDKKNKTRGLFKPNGEKVSGDIAVSQEKAQQMIAEHLEA